MYKLYIGWPWIHWLDLSNAGVSITFIIVVHAFIH